MKTKIQGFSIVELIVSIFILSVIAVSAAGFYKYYIPKAQFNESISMMQSEASNMLSANTMGLCTVTGQTQQIKGKYGILSVGGKFNKVSGKTCPTGCELSYKFNSEDVHKTLADKIVEATFTAGGQISKSNKTTVSSSLIPASFSAVPVASGDNCTVINDSDLTATPGSINGTDINTNADLPTLTPEAGGTIEKALIITKNYRGTSYQADGYYVKAVVNAYDFAASELGYNPGSTDNLTIIVDSDVALVGYNSVPVNQTTIKSFYRDSSHKAAGALIFDSRWNSVGSIQLENRGLIYGAGGAAGWWGVSNSQVLGGENGYTALLNQSSKNILVKNSGRIAGGGGGGSASHGTAVGGGGAPFSQHYVEPYYASTTVIPKVSTLLSGAVGTIWLDPKPNYYVYGGKGGDPGYPGAYVTMSRCCYTPGGTYDISNGAAGKVREGNFVITNTGAGWYKGSDISSAP